MQVVLALFYRDGGSHVGFEFNSAMLRTALGPTLISPAKSVPDPHPMCHNLKLPMVLPLPGNAEPQDLILGGIKRNDCTRGLKFIFRRFDTFKVKIVLAIVSFGYAIPLGISLLDVIDENEPVVVFRKGDSSVPTPSFYWCVIENLQISSFALPSCNIPLFANQLQVPVSCRGPYLSEI